MLQIILQTEVIPLDLIRGEVMDLLLDLGRVLPLEDFPLDLLLGNRDIPVCLLEVQELGMVLGRG